MYYNANKNVDIKSN